MKNAYGASGVSLSRPDLRFFIFGGDGDAFSIGANSNTIYSAALSSGSARR